MQWLQKIKQKIIPRDLRDTEALDKTAQDFVQIVQKAEDTADPADRLLAALTARLSLHTYAKSIGAITIARAMTMSERTDGVLAGVAVLGGAALVLAIAPAAGLVCLVGGFAAIVANVGTGAAMNMTERVIDRAVAPHVEKIGALEDRATDIASRTLGSSTVEIAASPKFGAIYDRFPEIRDHFNKAFNQSAAKKLLETAAAAQPAPQPQTGPLRL